MFSWTVLHPTADTPLGIIRGTLLSYNACFIYIKVTRQPLNREESQHLKTIKALEVSSRSCVCCCTKSWVTSTRANEFAGSVVLCLMTSLTPMLHIVSQASGNRSAADVPTLPPGAHRLARRTDAFWQGRRSNPLLLWHSLQDTSICSPLLWETISLAPIQKLARLGPLICISLLPPVPVPAKGKKKKKGREGKIDGEMTSCASPSGLCFFNGHKLKLNLYGEEEAEEDGESGGKQNCQKATILLISFSLCALSKEGERKKGALIIRGVESSNRWNNVPLLFFLLSPYRL